MRTRTCCLCLPRFCAVGAPLLAAVEGLPILIFLVLHSVRGTVDARQHT
jgi:hypothetical protein